MNDSTGRVRPVSIYFPSATSRPFGYGYSDMRLSEPQYMYFKSDMAYSQMHSRTPEWEGMQFEEIQHLLPRKWRMINLYNVDYYRTKDRFDGMRLTIFVDDQGVITSLSYS
jgi:hypothetical protein